MSLARASLEVGAAAGGSRVLGFARDLLIARALGAGPAADALLAALRLPSALRRILTEGGFEAGFVPLYAAARAEGGDAAARRFARAGLAGLALALAGMSALVMLGAGAVVLAVASGFMEAPGTLHLATALTRLAAPVILGLGLAACLGAWLNAEGRVRPAALAPLAVNVLLVLTLLGLTGSDTPPDDQARAIALAFSVGGFVQLALVGIAARDLLRAARPSWSEQGRALALLVRRGVPAMLASGAAQLMLVAATQVASFTPSGVALLSYADRVFQLPLGLVAAGAGAVLLPALVGASDHRAARDALNRAVEGALLLSLPAAAGLAALSLPITRFLFERGAFTAQDSAGTAAALLGLSLGLPFAALGKVLAPAALERGTVGFAVTAGGIGIAVTLAAGAVLGDAFGLLGLGLGVSAGLTAHAATLAGALLASGRWRPDRRLVGRGIRIAGAALPLLLLHRVAPEGGAALIGTVILGALAYAGLALIVGAVTRDDLARLRPAASAPDLAPLPSALASRGRAFMKARRCSPRSS
ncbi:MAG TPA: murein biosynthesis integral membrane protein MurJ [Beijerinckiaceae bacterium]|jgi:putative peptidoglycan lipid II flippase